MKTKCLLTAFITLLLALPCLALYHFDFPAEIIGRTYNAETRVKKDHSLFGLSTTRFDKIAERDERSG